MRRRVAFRPRGGVALRKLASAGNPTETMINEVLPEQRANGVPRDDRNEDVRHKDRKNQQKSPTPSKSFPAHRDVCLPRASLPAYPLRGGVDFADYISDCTKSQSNSMTFAVRGIPQHTFREMRFADLLFVTWRHRIPCFIEDGPQELDRRWIVCATIAHRCTPPVRPPFGKQS